MIGEIDELQLDKLKEMLIKFEDEGLYPLLLSIMVRDLEKQLGKLTPLDVDAFKVLSAKRHLVNEFVNAINEIKYYQPVVAGDKE